MSIEDMSCLKRDGMYRPYALYRPKELGKCFVYKAAAASRQRLQALAEKAASVSFDVFDTLVKRDVAAPEDVFAYIEHEIEKNEEITIQHFSARRISAETKARENARGREVTLAEIYEYLLVDEAQKERLMEMECQAEIDLSTVDLAIKPLYESCIEQGKAVYFISDMYLPAEVIGKILRKNGYTEGKLFVSSESGLTKHSGKLFAYVRESEGLEYKKWVHVGDGISSDYLAPKRLGITACLIERDPHINEYYDKKLYRSSADYRQLNHFIDTRIGRYTDPYERIGYAVLGPLLYGFSRWLEKEVPQDETIVFLAREGALLKRAFEVISDRPSVYFYISRRAVNIPLAGTADRPEKALQYKTHKTLKMITQAEFAMSYGISYDEMHRIFQEKGLLEETVIQNDEMKLGVLEAIWDVFKSGASVQKKLLQRYIEQSGLSEKCALVDVGWFGTMQALLVHTGYQAKGKTIDWRGYYCGDFSKDEKGIYEHTQKKAFLFKNGEHHQDIYEGVLNSVQFFEWLFLSTQGTTLGYKEESDGHVEPVLGEPENTDEVNGMIGRIQEAAVRFVRDYSASCVSRICVVDTDTAAGNYLAVGRVPSLDTLSLFRDIQIYDGDKYRLVPEHGLGWYSLHPREFKHDFLQTGCKAWFLKGVFKIPLPYVYLLLFLRTVSGQ